MKANSWITAPMVVTCIALMCAVGVTGTAEAWITDCSKPIILPEVKFKDATLEEAIACIKKVVQKHDLFGSGSLNVIVQGATEEQKKKRISMDVQGMQLRSVFDQIAKMLDMRLRIDAYAVVLLPAATSKVLVTRIYRVPHDFIQAGSAVK